MSDANTSLSRRQFLVGCAGSTAVAAMPAVAGAQPFGEEGSPSLASTKPGTKASVGAGDISLEGQMAMADVERRFQQQRPQMDRTVSAVDDLGLDPSGGTPINGDFGSALSGMSNTRVVFPQGGTFALSGHITATPEGPVELIGNGSSFVIPSGMETKSLTLVLPGGSLVRDIVIDQSAQGALQELSIQSDGVVRADNVTIKGYAPAKPSSSDGGGGVDAMFSPIARTSEAVVRATNFTAVGGTAAGTHNEGDLPPDSPENTLGSPMGVWVGQSNEGMVQFVKPELRGWSNGIYGGRTNGIVEVRGGFFPNNFNSQWRLGGGSVVDGATALLDDRQWSDEGPFKIGHQGVYVARVDAKKGNQTDPVTFKNCEVVANSMREGAALFEWENESGPGIVRNCGVTNHLDRPVFRGLSPSAPAATNVMVDQCLIGGSSPSAVMEMEGRPQSKIQRTCITIPDAGPDDINGAEIGSGVSFGRCTGESGLAAPEKVGSSGNLSSLPAPNASYNSSTGYGTQRSPNQGNWIGQLAAGVAQVMALGFLFLVSLFGFVLLAAKSLISGD
jgi:hypothetical protein